MTVLQDYSALRSVDAVSFRPKITIPINYRESMSSVRHWLAQMYVTVSDDAIRALNWNCGEASEYRCWPPVGTTLNIVLLSPPLLYGESRDLPRNDFLTDVLKTGLILCPQITGPLLIRENVLRPTSVVTVASKPIPHLDNRSQNNIPCLFRVHVQVPELPDELNLYGGNWVCSADEYAFCIPPHITALSTR